MLPALIAVLVYEGLVALAFVLSWRLVRGVDTRLPIPRPAAADPAGGTGPMSYGGPRPAPRLSWQVFTLIVGAAVLAVVAFTVTSALGDLRIALAPPVATASAAFPADLIRLALPLGQLAILLVLHSRLRQSVLFPTVAVHLFLLLFCLLVSLLAPGRMELARLTLMPIFVTNLVLLVITHGLLTLLFCERRRELLAAVILAGIAGAILALGTTAIALVSTLNAGPLFFFQLYLISAFGIFGLYFCASSVLLSVTARS